MAFSPSLSSTMPKTGYGGEFRQGERVGGPNGQALKGSWASVLKNPQPTAPPLQATLVSPITSPKISARPFQSPISIPMMMHETPVVCASPGGSMRSPSSLPLANSAIPPPMHLVAQAITSPRALVERRSPVSAERPVPPPIVIPDSLSINGAEGMRPAGMIFATEEEFLCEQARQMLSVGANEFSPVGPACGATGMPQHYYPAGIVHQGMLVPPQMMQGVSGAMDMVPYYMPHPSAPGGFYSAGYPYQDRHGKLVGDVGRMMPAAGVMQMGMDDAHLMHASHGPLMDVAMMNMQHYYGFMPYGYGPVSMVAPTGPYIQGPHIHPEYYGQMMEGVPVQMGGYGQQGQGQYSMAPRQRGGRPSREKVSVRPWEREGRGGRRGSMEMQRGASGDVHGEAANAGNGGQEKLREKRDSISRTSSNTRSQSDEGVEAYKLDVSKIESGEDKRTTVMIKNIPNKYSQRNLLELIDTSHKGTYDFFYLPIDFRNKCNLGYAFINFKNPSFIPQFFRDFADKRWEKFNSEKVCEVSYARIQGWSSLVNHFRTSRLLLKHEKYRPLIFNDTGSSEVIPTTRPLGPRPRQGSVPDLSAIGRGSPGVNGPGAFDAEDEGEFSGDADDEEYQENVEELARLCGGNDPLVAGNSVTGTLEKRVRRRASTGA